MRWSCLWWSVLVFPSWEQGPICNLFSLLVCPRVGAGRRHSLICGKRFGESTLRFPKKRCVYHKNDRNDGRLAWFSPRPHGLCRWLKRTHSLHRTSGLRLRGRLLAGRSTGPKTPSRPASAHPALGIHQTWLPLAGDQALSLLWGHCCLVLSTCRGTCIC